MNRPDKKNALTSAMYDAHGGSRIAGAKTTPEIRCVLIAGVPGAFCAGNDMEEFRQAAETGEGLSDSVHPLPACAAQLASGRWSPR